VVLHQTAQTKPGVPQTSWLVSFSYSNDDIRPVSAMRVVMIAPGGNARKSAPSGEHSGAWIELRDPKSGAHWTRVIHQPNRADVEVSIDSGRCARVKRYRVEGEFELIIPDFGPDAVFKLYASPALAPEKAASVRVGLELAELVQLERNGSSIKGATSKPPDRTRE
jgi:hypothetical protein